MARTREHSREEFVEAAVRIVDNEGIDALTARRLGAEVGVSSTAVYTYFPSRASLVTALVDFMVASIIESVESNGGTIKDRLVAFALAARRVFEKHPRLAGVFVVASGNFEQGNEGTKSVVAILEEAGLSGDDLVEVYRIIETYILGGSAFDFGSAPDHFVIRQGRYQSLDHVDFANVAESVTRIHTHSDAAYIRGFHALLTGLGL